MAELIHELLLDTAARTPDSLALKSGPKSASYGELGNSVEAFAKGLVSIGVGRHDRVAILMDKSLECVVSIYGTAMAGCVFVPVNTLLKPEQVGYILKNCSAKVLVTTAAKARAVKQSLADCVDLRHLVVVGEIEPDGYGVHLLVHQFDEMLRASGQACLHRTIDADMAAILYTSGSTGHPKGVVLSHRNMVVGAKSVAQYLENTANDRILAVLPLSFDYGLSQLSTGFLVGASVVLHNYLLAGDLVRVMARERITGLAAVPPLWIQICSVAWPASVAEHLRYFTNSGGAMPTAILEELRRRVPQAKPYLMYGLTEAFRSTFLPPEEADNRPTSIGKAIPNAEILVLRPDGSICDTNEPGELVHRGGLVAMGYWQDPVRTAERFRTLTMHGEGTMLPEVAVWSGDTVLRDADGFLYFVSRRDEMIKTSGYRVSPTEVEEAIYRSGLVAEAAVFGVPHPTLGEAIMLTAKAKAEAPVEFEQLIAACREFVPAYMLPIAVKWFPDGLPRNPNGKIDRKALADLCRAIQ